MIVFGGNASVDLLIKVCSFLNIPLGKILVSKFPDGETRVEVGESVRGKDVFILQSTSPPVNDNLMELFFMIDALRRASARRITGVIPYFGYSRQDRKHIGRVPISAKIAAGMIEKAGADRVLTVDLHASQIQGFFEIPVDHFPGYLPFKDGFHESMKELVVVASDTGSAERAENFANKFNVPQARIEKRRTGEKTEVRGVIGDVEGKTALLVDDIISTGGTMAGDAEALIKKGAKRIIASATHGVFSPGSKDTLDNSDIEKIYVTDSVKPVFPLPRKAVCEHSVVPFLAEGIRRIHENLSVGEIIEHT